MADAQGSDNARRVKRFTLAQLIADAMRRVPGAIGAKLVKRKGRMEVQVEVKDFVKDLTQEPSAQ
jgi:hypothetical protein